MVISRPTNGLDKTGVELPWCRMGLAAETSQGLPRRRASYYGLALQSCPPHHPLLSPHLLLLLAALLSPAAGGQNGELCVVETPLRTQYVRPVVETSAVCHGCLFPAPTPPTPAPDTHTPPIRQVHIVHVDEPEGGAVEVMVTGQQTYRVVLVLHSSRDAPVVFTITSSHPTNTTNHLFLVSGEDEVRGSNLRYSVAHQQRVPQEDLISSTQRKFGFVTSYTRAPQANTIALHLPNDEEADGDCNMEVKDDSPVANCFMSVEQPISGCYHHNMLGENNRDIHIIEVDGSSNSNGSLVLSVVGSSEGGSGDVSAGGGREVERNITLVLRTSRPTTWSLHATSLQGTITLLVGGRDQVENTSVSGPGVVVKVERINVPASFDGLILTVLTSVGPPVSYTRTTSPNKITVTVLPKSEIQLDPLFYLPVDAAAFRYVLIWSLRFETCYRLVDAEDVAAVIQAALSVSCDESTMTVAIPYDVSERVGGISMSLRDHSCTGAMNISHIVIRENFSRCKFTRQNSPYQTTYTNYVSVDLGPSLSDDEDFDGSGYGIEDEYHGARIAPIQVQCQVHPHPPPHRETPAPQSTNKKTVSEPVAGATYKMEMFRDSDHEIPITTDNYPASTNINHRLYIKTALASVMPWTEEYDADLRIVLEECWLSNSSASSRTGALHEPLVRKSCPLRSSVNLEPMLFNSQTSSFSFQVLSEYSYLGSFFLHCQLGVCSADSLPRPAVNRCIDPGHYCGKATLMRVFDTQPSSSSLQTLALGPFSMAPSTESSAAWSGSNMKTSDSSDSVVQVSDSTSSSSSVTGATDDKTQIIVLGGLSTEIVVGIALASFVIGVCLTATLWVIHMKTDPRRQKRPEGGAPRNSGYDLSAHSGSSTPSSQAPMTA
ncbi:transforming growth factor beta receptor type 3-like [Homarus americanus]|uniref:transforming growth factor beta receptor type 3-like n=1 Tax=Homarus americanus TaxID=6706 RepID=UPI001C4817E1|nr:transforming growth factor beta receptor type 3-like [Homarus americanus]